MLRDEGEDKGKDLGVQAPPCLYRSLCRSLAAAGPASQEIPLQGDPGFLGLKRLARPLALQKTEVSGGFWRARRWRAEGLTAQGFVGRELQWPRGVPTRGRGPSAAGPGRAGATEGKLQESTPSRVHRELNTEHRTLNTGLPLRAPGVEEGFDVLPWGVGREGVDR